MKRIKTVTSVFAAIGLTAAAAMAQDDVLAVSWTGDVYTIDSSSGSGSLLNGSRTFTGLNATAKDASGQIFTTSSTSLLKVDSNTGVVTLVGTMGINSVRGMDFAPDGTLYAYNDEGFGTPDVLYSIDPNTGASTFVGLASHTGVQGLAIDSAGNAYGWDIGQGLLSCNLATGATATVGNFGGTGDIQCIAFDANDDLYGCRNEFFSISTSDGSYSLIGSGGYTDVRGADFIGGEAGYRLRISGQCPGQLTVSWSGANPSRQQGLVFGAQQGSTTIPNGVCQGTVLGIQGQVRLVNTFGTGSGEGSVNGNAGTGACGGYLQLIEAPACATSNVGQIP